MVREYVGSGNMWKTTTVTTEKVDDSMVPGIPVITKNMQDLADKLDMDPHLCLYLYSRAQSCHDNEIIFHQLKGLLAAVRLVHQDDATEYMDGVAEKINAHKKKQESNRKFQQDVLRKQRQLESDRFAIKKEIYYNTAQRLEKGIRRDDITYNDHILIEYLEKYLDRVDDLNFKFVRKGFFVKTIKLVGIIPTWNMNVDEFRQIFLYLKSEEDNRHWGRE